jgi:hypothetical protein
MSLKSPLRTKPLRHAGQSLDEELLSLWDDRGMGYCLFAGGFLIVAVLEWVGYALNVPRRPWLFTAVAIVAVAIATVQILRLRKQAQNIRLGRDGERLVGQFLEELRVDGASVFHDVPGDGFNLDHVVISDRGVIVIETKTRSKPSPDAKVTFDGDDLLVAGRKPDRDPIRQVRAEVSWLLELLRQSTGKSFPMRGAVVFPYWWVERAPESVNKDVWVLEPKALPAFIRHEAVKLAEADVKLATFHLSQYIRSKV